MSRFNKQTYKDRFGSPYNVGATVVYPVRRGSFMELVTGYVVEHSEQYVGGLGYKPALRIRREHSTNTTLVRNLNDLVVVQQVPEEVTA